MKYSRIKEREFYKSLNASAYKRVMQERQNLAVVNTKTGEIVPYYEPTPVLSENQNYAYKNLSKLDQHHEENGGFVSAFYEQQKPMVEQLPTLTQSDYARLIYISTYTGYPERGNVFGYLRYDNQYYIDKNGLFKLLDMSMNKFNEFYKKVTELKILEETDDGKIIMNPFYFYRGDYKEIDDIIANRQHIRMYRKTIRELYRQCPKRQIKRLGLIYAVLPYINPNFNIIAHNPDEKDVNFLKPMRLGELADKLGYANADTLKRALRSIRFDRKPVFQFIEDEPDNRKRKIIVNPSVVFGGNGEVLDEIKAMFND